MKDNHRNENVVITAMWAAIFVQTALVFWMLLA